MNTTRRANREAVRGIGFALCMFTLSRLLRLLTVLTGSRVSTKSFRGAFLTQDPHWYHLAAMNGYPHVAVANDHPVAEHIVDKAAENTIAFFPLYPMLSRGLHYITGMSYLQACVAVSWIFGAVATVLLWFLARHLLDAKSANRAAALFAFFPASMAMLAPMSEGVMLTFAIGSVLALLQRRWLIAGLCAGLATAARPNALVLVLCCAWVAFLAIKRDREWRALAAPLLAPTGILAYFLFLWHHTGDFLAWWHVENAGWAYDKYAPFSSLGAIFYFWEAADGVAMILALVAAFVGLCWLIKWRPPAELTIFAAGIVLLAFEAGGTHQRRAMCGLRFHSSSPQRAGPIPGFVSTHCLRSSPY